MTESGRMFYHKTRNFGLGPPRWVVYLGTDVVALFDHEPTFDEVGRAIKEYRGGKETQQAKGS